MHVPFILLWLAVHLDISMSNVTPDSPNSFLERNNSFLSSITTSLETPAPGLHLEHFPEPIFYDSVLPVIYEYITPNWNKTDVTFANWFTCFNDTAPYSEACALMFYMKNTIAKLHVDFVGLHPISDKNTKSAQQSMRDYYTRIINSRGFCHAVKEHFAGIWTEAADYTNYLTALENCSADVNLQPVIIRNISDYNYSISEPFVKMRLGFYKTFYNPLYALAAGNKTLELIASAALSNSMTSLQGSLLGQFYAEKNRWVHANQDCRQGMIPTSLVTFDKLNHSLSLIETMTRRTNQNVLSIDFGQVSKYFTLPLTDCTHTEDTLVVRILIPILKISREKSLELIHLEAIPLEYMNYYCFPKLAKSETGQDTIVGNKAGNGASYIFDRLNGLAYRTLCEPNKLCKISDEQLNETNSDFCVSALLSKKLIGVDKLCEFYCMPKEKYALPTYLKKSQITKMMDILEKAEIEDILMLNTQILGTNHQERVNRSQTKRPVSKKQILTESSESGSGMGALFWTGLTLIMGIVLGMQIYIIVEFKRFQAVSYVKDNQIIYHADSDTI